jgi:superfamily II DNA helicase RecQ
LTATAGRETQARILSSLGVPDAAVFVHGVDRPNIALLRLSVSVEQRPGMIASLLRLAGRLNVKAMVFVPTRRIGEGLLQHLSAEALPTPFFHGQLGSLVKDSLLQRLLVALRRRCRGLSAPAPSGWGSTFPTCAW